MTDDDTLALRRYLAIQDAAFADNVFLYALSGICARPPDINSTPQNKISEAKQIRDAAVKQRGKG